MMKRREFITLLGAATAWPLAARAQRTGKMSRIGYLGVSSPSLEPHYIEAFRQKLRDLGHIDGENIAIEYRWAEGQDDRLPNLATELVHLKPDVIVTSGTPGTLAAMQATRTIPIVMASSADPVNAGLVARLARPRRERYGIYNPGCGVGRQTTGVSQASDPGALAPSRPLESEQSGHRIFAPTGKRRLCTAHAKSRRCAQVTEATSLPKATPTTVAG